MSNLEKLININKYQVFVLNSQASFPLTFALHPWLVTNERGVITRYEIKHSAKLDKSYLYVNDQPPFQGLPWIWPINRFFQPAQLLGFLEGDENSRAKILVDKIKSSPLHYPFRNKYAFLGANCATYIAWAIKDFPEIKIKLPWNAFGKNYYKSFSKTSRN